MEGLAMQTVRGVITILPAKLTTAVFNYKG